MKSEEEIQTMIKEVDSDNTGAISFDNFIKMMSGEEFVQNAQGQMTDLYKEEN